MRHWFRDFFRKRRVNRHIANDGSNYVYNGVSVTVPLEAGLGVCNALLRGKYEREEAALIAKYLPRDVPVIELGGSLGVVSALIGSRLDPETAHVIVEANPDVLAICENNATGGGVRKKAALRHAAVAYGAKTVSFPIGSEVHANALGKDDGAQRMVTVEAVTLGSLYQDIGSPDSFSLVCDIEGGELDMVRHDPGTLSKAGIVIMELHPDVYGGSDGGEGEIIGALQAAGLELVERLADVVVMRRRG